MRDLADSLIIDNMEDRITLLEKELADLRLKIENESYHNSHEMLCMEGEIKDCQNNLSETNMVIRSVVRRFSKLLKR